MKMSSNNHRQQRSIEPPRKLLIRAASFVPFSHCIAAVSSIPILYVLLNEIVWTTTSAIDLPPPPSSDESPYSLLLRGASLVPGAHYGAACFLFLAVWLYIAMDFHLLGCFRGYPVSLAFHPKSELYLSVVSRCRILHRRFSPTPWLASPHLQTLFVGIFSRVPQVNYTRELFYASDGATIALDWLRESDVAGHLSDRGILSDEDDGTPIVIVLPGFACDSDSPYMKHVAHKMATGGWNVCLSNHRGFGGVRMTSDSFVNGGWTSDIREVVNYIHHQYPKSALFAIGTSVGANILIKYLGENGIEVPLMGAAAISSPWDLLAFDRFLSRKFVQRFYNKFITLVLHSHLQVQNHVISRLADWELLQKTRTLRDAYNVAPCLIENSKTVDMHYRESSSINFISKVTVPLLCVNSLDDPISPMEAIPWDECRENKNVVLATTKTGGHIAHVEGWNANRLWWLSATDEFFNILNSTRPIVAINGIRVFSMPNPLKLQATLNTWMQEDQTPKTRKNRRLKHSISWSPRDSIHEKS